MVAMSGMPWLGVGDLFCCGHVGAGGDRRKPGEWGFCNSVHVVLANRFPSCL
jgi:hypothetical protein